MTRDWERKKIQVNELESIWFNEAIPIMKPHPLSEPGQSTANYIFIKLTNYQNNEEHYDRNYTN